MSQSTVEPMVSVIILTSTGSFLFRPIRMISSYASSGESFSSPSFSFWNLEPVAISVPALHIVSPPTMSFFSIRMTDLPMEAALVAAAMPPPPAPMTTMSALISLVSESFSVSTSVLNAVPSGSTSFRASRQADSMPTVVTVAPDTLSTLKVLLSTISCGTLATATSPIPCVSVLDVTSTSVSLLSLTVTLTEIGPLLPVPVPS